MKKKDSLPFLFSSSTPPSIHIHLMTTSMHSSKRTRSHLLAFTIDRLSQLPVECLEHILIYITSMLTASARSILAALCRVNKHISRVAFPFLCRDSFSLSKEYACGSASPNRRARALVCSLITHTLAVHPPSYVLILGLDIYTNAKYHTTSSLLSPIRLNRLALVRHLNIDTNMFLKREKNWSNSKWNCSALSAAEQDYIHKQGFLEMYLIDRKDATCRKGSECDQLTHYFPNVLYREATWTRETHSRPA
jgi:hypothetical protein